MSKDQSEVAVIDERIATLPADKRSLMEAIRAAVREAAPDATECIYYQMPAFRQDGRFLVAYEAFKDHVSLFPANSAVATVLGAEIAPYVAGKGTFHFGLDVPVPSELIRKIVAVRLEEEAAKVAAKASKPKKTSKTGPKAG